MARRAAGPLFTIGYEQATSNAVIGELERARVEVLVDVRAIAASRRPGFSKRQLEAGLAERDILYLHLRDLGTPTEGRLAARSGKVVDMFRIYETHLGTPQAREELDVLASLVRSSQRICVLCYERNPAQCHRRRIAEVMHERTGVPVEHLFAPQV
jgi:uncharacterized protein (DUF488 family)